MVRYQYKSKINHHHRRHCINVDSARKILHAERFARSIGRPMNYFVTITFNPLLTKAIAQLKLGGSLPDSYHDAYRTFRKINTSVSRALRHQNSLSGVKQPFLYAVVFENPLRPNGLKTARYGPMHVHWLMRINESQIAMVEKFARKILEKNGFCTKLACVDIRKAPKSAGVAMYMAKGIDPQHADRFFVKHVPQGPIHHRRIIISRAITQGARRKFRAETGLSPFHFSDLKRKRLGSHTFGPKHKFPSHNNRTKRPAQQHWRQKTQLPW